LVGVTYPKLDACRLLTSSRRYRYVEIGSEEVDMGRADEPEPDRGGWGVIYALAALLTALAALITALNGCSPS
jgi:hypothetical protein